MAELVSMSDSRLLNCPLGYIAVHDEVEDVEWEAVSRCRRLRRSGPFCSLAKVTPHYAAQERNALKTPSDPTNSGIDRMPADGNIYRLPESGDRHGSTSDERASAPNGKHRMGSTEWEAPNGKHR